MWEYVPNPIDTSQITLPQDIGDLAEKLAENTHEIWAWQRIEGGWTYGETRDDHNLKHPCLVPYDDLPESEKEFDRQTALEAIKCMIYFGYRIEKN